jgi:hypothetical protein
MGLGVGGFRMGLPMSIAGFGACEVSSLLRDSDHLTLLALQPTVTTVTVTLTTVLFMCCVVSRKEASTYSTHRQPRGFHSGIPKIVTHSRTYLFGRDKARIYSILLS